MAQNVMVLRLLWFAIDFMLFVATPVTYLLAFASLFHRRRWLLVFPVINAVVGPVSSSPFFLRGLWTHWRSIVRV